MRLGEFKLVRSGTKGTWELFNLKLDRTEQNNLAASQPEKAKEFAELLGEWASTNQGYPCPRQKN